MWPFSSSTSEPDAPPSTRPVSRTRLLEEVPQSAVKTQDLSPTTHVSDYESPQLKLTGYRDERLGIQFLIRAPLLMSASFFCGFSLGAAKGGRIYADRYRAENAHRMPTTQSGWFLYHKSKNYNAMFGGMKEGAKFGTVLTGWATLFMVTEEMVDRSRERLFAKGDDERVSGQRDAANTVVAAMSVAGLYSWRRGFDKFATARMAKMALKYSLIYGLVQDMTASLRDDRPAYVDWIARKTFWPSPSRSEL